MSILSNMEPLTIRFPSQKELYRAFIFMPVKQHCSGYFRSNLVSPVHAVRFIFAEFCPVLLS